jgi:hypothetical protein
MQDILSNVIIRAGSDDDSGEADILFTIYDNTGLSGECTVAAFVTEAEELCFTCGDPGEGGFLTEDWHLWAIWGGCGLIGLVILCCIFRCCAKCIARKKAADNEDDAFDSITDDRL